MQGYERRNCFLCSFDAHDTVKTGGTIWDLFLIDDELVVSEFLKSDELVDRTKEQLFVKEQDPSHVATWLL